MSLERVFTTLSQKGFLKQIVTQVRIPFQKPLRGSVLKYIQFQANRIYNKIVDRDWFSARLFVT